MAPSSRFLLGLDAQMMSTMIHNNYLLEEIKSYHSRNVAYIRKGLRKFRNCADVPEVSPLPGRLAAAVL